MERAAQADPLTARPSRSLTVLIPTKNEADNIGWVLRRLPDCVDEVVLVDARSTDRTIEVARAIRPDVVVITDNGRGKGDAVREGVAAATGDDVVMIDADGSMHPEEIDRFVDKLREGHDLVKGSRFMPGAGTADMTLVRDLGHRVLLALSNFLYGTSRTDLCYGFAAFRRQAFEDLDLTADGFEIEAQLFLRAERTGLRVAEVASFEAPRRAGNSNLNTFRDGWRVLGTILAERLRRVPSRGGGSLPTESSPTIAMSSTPPEWLRPAPLEITEHGALAAADPGPARRAFAARQRRVGASATGRNAEID